MEYRWRDFGDQEDMSFDDIWHESQDPDKQKLHQEVLGSDCLWQDDYDELQESFTVIVQEQKAKYKRKKKQNETWREKHPVSDFGTSLNHKPLVQLMLESCKTADKPYKNVWQHTQCQKPKRSWVYFADDDHQDIQKKIAIADKLIDAFKNTNKHIQYRIKKFVAGYLKSDGFEIGQNALHYAVFTGQDDVTGLLLKHCDYLGVNDTQSIDYSRYGSGDYKVFSNKHMTVLHLAVRTKNVKVVKVLLARPELKVNATFRDGTGVWSVLHEAVDISVKTGSNEILELLLAHPNIDVNVLCAMNRTPLHQAVRKKAPKVVELLLKSPKIMVNAVDSFGMSALAYAVSLKIAKCMTLLVTHRGTFIDAGLAVDALRTIMEYTIREGRGAHDAAFPVPGVIDVQKTQGLRGEKKQQQTPKPAEEFLSILLSVPNLQFESQDCTNVLKYTEITENMDMLRAFLFVFKDDFKEYAFEAFSPASKTPRNVFRMVVELNKPDVLKMLLKLLPNAVEDGRAFAMHLNGLLEFADDQDWSHRQHGEVIDVLLADSRIDPDYN